MSRSLGQPQSDRATKNRAHPFSHERVVVPTIIWVESDYSVYTMRQAARRCWRIGQTPFLVVCMAYRYTLLEAFFSV